MSEAQAQPAKRRGRPKGTERHQLAQTIHKAIVNNPGISAPQLAESVGVARTTATAYLAKWGKNQADIDVFVQNRNAIVKSKQEEILRALTPDKMEKASAKDLAVSYGILLDKDRLESGESGNTVNNWLMIVQQSQIPVTNREQHVNSDPITVDITNT